MNFPLELKFKVLALAPQLSVTDSSGQLMFYVKQKLFKLKEAVTVFGDQEQTRTLFQIKADKIIDFSATYHITDSDGRPVGAVKRKGARSIFKAHYEIIEDGQVTMTITEDSAFVRLMDGIFGELPIVGILSGYVFHPSYTVKRGETELMRMTKQSAFLEGKFKIEELAQNEGIVRARCVLSLLMMVLLERSRG
ncbi:MAG: hypothetical protein AAF533_09405 [Acidobacteriota bacterium]